MFKVGTNMIKYSIRGENLEVTKPFAASYVVLSSKD